MLREILTDRAFWGALVLIGLLGASVLAGLPLLVAGVLGILASLAAMRGSTTSQRRVLWFNLAVVLAGLALFEAATDWNGPGSGRVEKWSKLGGIIHRDDVLGHRPKAGDTNRCRLFVDGEPVYDASYTIGANGLRIAPPSQPGDQNACILFFGGSYTFGEGVDDDQVTAFLVGQRTDGRFGVRNFGFSGYGPHHMLTAVKEGIVAEAANCRPILAIYQAHPHHVLRAAGKWWWDKNGPRYVLDAAGRLSRAGNFSDDKSLIQRFVGLSAAAKRVADDIRPNDQDLALFHAIVTESDRLLRQAYPDIRMHVLYWDVGPPELFARETGLTIHRLTKIFPAREDWDGVYRFEKDVHPTPLAHDLMAQYIIDTILPAFYSQPNDASAHGSAGLDARVRPE